MSKIGLVLAGGGGKGAYQIGVWKAMKEQGFDKEITAISGSSVGGLNAALMVQGDLERAENIWANINFRKICSPKRNSEKKKGVSIFSRTGLDHIISTELDMSVFDNSEINCYVACYGNKGSTKNVEELVPSNSNDFSTYRKLVNGRVTYFNLREYDPETRKTLLLATSAIPFIFPHEKIGNKFYWDAGMKDNTPVEPLYVCDKCDTVFLIYLDTNLKKLIDKEKYPGTRIIEICPKNDQGVLATLDFNPEHAKDRMRQGYDDTIRTLRECREIRDEEKGTAEYLKERIPYKRMMNEVISQQQRYLLGENVNGKR
jgi:NTE family protein